MTKPLNDLTADEVAARISYDPETGILTRIKTGKPTGYRRKDGYIVVGFRDRIYLAHRIAWLLATGEWPAVVIDHIDGDPSNNAINNLREATLSQNHQNTKCRGFYASYGKFQAEISVGSRKISLGAHSTRDEARAAYEAASREYFGEFSAVDRGCK